MFTCQKCKVANNEGVHDHCHTCHEPTRCKTCRRIAVYEHMQRELEKQQQGKKPKPVPSDLPEQEILNETQSRIVIADKQVSRPSSLMGVDDFNCARSVLPKRAR